MSFNLGESFANSWAGVIFNPIGYSLQHVSISKAAAEYRQKHPPAQAINPDTETEEGFIIHRQQWIDGCGASLKSRDVGYSKANAAQNCASEFDRDGITAQVQNAIFSKAAAEKVELKEKIAENSKKIFGFIAIILLIGVATYLLTSKSKS